MPKNNNFVSGGLIKVRNNIAEAAAKEGILTEKQTEEEEKSVPQAGNDNKSVNRDFKKALQKRQEEFTRIKRDIASRLTEKMTVIPVEQQELEKNQERLRNSLKKYEELSNRLENIDDSAWTPKNISAELGDAMRELENIRLEHVRQSTLDEQVNSRHKTLTEKRNDSLFHEINSLSFKQLFRLGFAFSFPAFIAILLGAIIIAASIFIAMKV
jgi:chromosome segregation ATPase